VWGKVDIGLVASLITLKLLNYCDYKLEAGLNG
jgi:hypothetical protein